MQGPQPTELSRLGLTRFRSAPATWLDALLDDNDNDDENDTVFDAVKPPPPPLDNHHHHFSGSLTQLLTSIGPVTDPTPGPVQPVKADPGYYSSAAGFQRMNSSPAEFFGEGVDGFFSGVDGISLGFVSGGVSVGGGGGGGGGREADVSPSGKRMRETDFEERSPRFGGQMRGELTTANSLVEMEMEKLLEDSVPCRVRAKRGCATHPRSIAERVRRTRISDRIRRLQELVPNMDKQTNTADMLEEAVEYVKTLQRQIQELKEQQKNCKCMRKS